VKLLGIQPKNIEFNTKMSHELEETSKEIAEILGNVLKEKK
jgi:hypothetical protein